MPAACMPCCIAAAPGGWATPYGLAGFHADDASGAIG
jgi:hypothetical protein